MDLVQKRRIELLKQWAEKAPQNPEVVARAAAITTPDTYKSNIKALLLVAEKNVKIILQRDNPSLVGSDDGVYDAFCQAINRGVNVDIITYNYPATDTWISKLWLNRKYPLNLKIRLDIAGDSMGNEPADKESAVIVDDKFVLWGFHDNGCVALLTRDPEFARATTMLFEAKSDHLEDHNSIAEDHRRHMERVDSNILFSLDECAGRSCRD